MGDVVPLRRPPVATSRAAQVVGDTFEFPAPITAPVAREHQLEAALLLAKKGLEAAIEALDISDDYRPIFVRPSLVAAIERGLAAAKDATS